MNKKMKKLMFALLAAVLAFSLAACGGGGSKPAGGGGGGESPAPAPASGGKLTGTVWVNRGEDIGYGLAFLEDGSLYYAKVKDGSESTGSYLYTEKSGNLSSSSASIEGAYTLKDGELTLTIDGEQRVFKPAEIEFDIDYKAANSDFSEISDICEQFVPLVSTVGTYEGDVQKYDAGAFSLAVPAEANIKMSSPYESDTKSEIYLYGENFGYEVNAQIKTSAPYYDTAEKKMEDVKKSNPDDQVEIFQFGGQDMVSRIYQSGDKSYMIIYFVTPTASEDRWLEGTINVNPYRDMTLDEILASSTYQKLAETFALH